MSTTSTNYGLTIPTVNDPADQNLFGYQINNDLVYIDALLKSALQFVPTAKTASFSVTAPTATSYLVGDSKKLFLCDATSGAITASLPAAAGCSGMVIAFKKVDSSANAITIDGNSTETIDGEETYSLPAQYDFVILACDATGWHVLSFSSGSTGTPTGSIIDYAGTTAPTGWLLCYGQAISRTTYSALFTAISTTYGAGDGSTTFNVPDLRGRVAAGRDDMGGTGANRLTGVTGSVNGDTLGGTGGEEAHALSIAELAEHTHFGFAAVAETQSAESAVNLTNSTQVAATAVSASDTRNYKLISTATAATVGLTSSTGSGTAHNTVQPTIILNKIIKI